MPRVSKQTAGKIGMFSAIMIIFGAVVGIGIFFKNSTVFDLNNNNWLGVILSWVLSIIIIMCTALSFAEISTVRTSNRNAGFGGWSQTMCHHGFGRYSKIGYSFSFYSMNTFAVVFFAGEAIMNCFAKLGQNGSDIGGFDFGKYTTLYVFVAGGGLFALLLLLNYFVSKGMTKFSNVAGLIKFVPIGMVIILGIVFGVLYKDNGLWPSSNIVNGGSKDNLNIGSFDLLGMTRAIPAILFAYEGFLVVGNIGGDMKDPRKEVPIAVVLGVGIISLLYLLITIGCMFVGSGSAYDLMKAVSNPTVSKILTYVISILIYVCLIGTLNALIFSGARGWQAICRDGTIFRGVRLANKKPNNELFAGIVWMAISNGLWWVITIVPSVLANTDCIADAPSVVMIVYLYIIYFGNILYAFINRFTNKHETKHFTIFPFAAIIAMLGALLIFGVCGIYQFIVMPIQEINKNGINADFNAGWGLFLKTRTVVDSYGNITKTINYLSCWEVIAWFWGMFILTAAVPFINDFLIKHFDRGNHERLIWERINH